MALLPATLDKPALRRELLRWFDSTKRDLPWRRTCDPYAIWVAEIMLQQTRVAAVLEHYREFLRRFPSVEALAQARTPAVLAAWSGLGYYRRARSLHAAAKLVVRDHGGMLPDDLSALLKLPGIGRYTASAIASTAFGRRCAVVDGNVERVLRRLVGVAQPHPSVVQRSLAVPNLWRIADELLSPRRPGDFNQAMMELGATVCAPTAPDCDACPLRSWCATRGELPGRKAKDRRKRAIAYGLVVKNRCVLLVQRGANASLMPGMWELPETTVARVCRPRSRSTRARHIAGGPEITLAHSITNTDYAVTVIRAAAPQTGAGRWIRVSRLQQLPLTGLARKILRRADII